jgi:hypothetical protein
MDDRSLGSNCRDANQRSDLREHPVLGCCFDSYIPSLSRVGATARTAVGRAKGRNWRLPDLGGKSLQRRTLLVPSVRQKRTAGDSQWRTLLCSNRDFVASGSGTQSHQVLVFPGKQSHGRGRGFEPRRPRHRSKRVTWNRRSLIGVQKGHQNVPLLHPNLAMRSFRFLGFLHFRWAPPFELVKKTRATRRRLGQRAWPV